LVDPRPFHGPDLPSAIAQASAAHAWPARGLDERRGAKGLQDGRLDERFRKGLLPTYDVFDEDRYFEPFRGPQVLTLDSRRLGISICEDVWNDRDFWKRRRYHFDPIQELIGAGVDAIVYLGLGIQSNQARLMRVHMFDSILETMRALTDPLVLFEEAEDTLLSLQEISQIEWPDDRRPES